MCDIGTAISIGASAYAANEEEKAANKMSAQNRSSAISSMNNQAATEQLRFEEENRGAVQEAYELALEGRASEATFLNQAAISGVTGISVNEAFFGVQNKNARTNNKFIQEQQSRKTQFGINMSGLQAQTANQINSVAEQSGGVANALLEGGGTAAGKGKLDKYLT